jgi:hypothetical protein
MGLQNFYWKLEGLEVDFKPQSSPQKLHSTNHYSFHFAIRFHFVTCYHFVALTSPFYYSLLHSILLVIPHSILPLTSLLSLVIIL